MISSDVNTNPDEHKQESFLIEQTSLQQQQPTINIIDSKLLTTSQLNAQPQQVQQIIANNTSANNLPFIIQNGNIYQLTTGGTNQLNSSNLIQISGDQLKSTNPIKLTTFKNTNVLNLNSVNKGRIIVKTNPSEIGQGQQIITTISPNSLNNHQKLNQQNQLKAINLVLQNANQPKQLIIANQQNKPQLTNQNGSPIIVLTPSNRTINDQNLQILLQQKNQNIVQTSTVNIPTQTAQIQQVKTNNIQQKIFVPQTGCVNLVKKPINQINENEVKQEVKTSNPNLISLLNSNHQTEVKQEPIVSQPKVVYTPKPQKEVANITPIASKQQSANPNPPVEQKEELNEAILNECILPDTRIFASLLNKDHSLPNNNAAQKNEIKYKTVLIGNTEHVILDNLQNLSDFKGNFTELKNLACSVATHLNKSVSIPAFLLIDSKSSVEKIKSLLGDININPIIIDTLTQGSQQSEPKAIDPNADREKFNQHHQNLIKKLSSSQPETAVSSPASQPQEKAPKKVSTPKRRAPKPKKTQIIVNSSGQATVNKSKLTINDLIQQNAMNQSLEMEKSSEPTAKKIKTINQLVEQKLVQPVVQTMQPHIVQTHIQQIQQLQPVQQAQLLQQHIQTLQPIQQQQMEQPKMQQPQQQQQQQQSNDWLDQQIQIANEFIDTLTKSDESQNSMVKTECLDMIKNEPVLIQNLVDINQQQQLQQNNSNLQMLNSHLSNEYNFEIDPFDTNLYFSSNLNDIEF